MRGMTAIWLLSGALLFGAAGCSEAGPAEKAGKAFDEAVEDAGDKMEEAAEAAEKKAKEDG
jgi:hypothetical protein